MLVIPATQQAEAGELLEPGEVVVKQDHATALQPGQQSETPSQKKKMKCVLQRSQRSRVWRLCGKTGPRVRQKGRALRAGGRMAEVP